MNNKKARFIQDYKSLVRIFTSENNFIEIDCGEKKIEWPKKSGVYVIWRNTDNSFDNLIYVGMTGKFSRLNDQEVIFNSGDFTKRKARYTPYKFCESPKDADYLFSFRYGPLEKNSSKQQKIQYQDNAYRNTIPYREILIHCFLISEDHKEYTPELLEKLILTKYLKSSDNLPPANNEL